MNPAFGKIPNMLTYCEDITVFLGRSDCKDVFVKYFKLSSAQTHKTPQIIEMDGVKTEVIVKRSVCARVKLIQDLQKGKIIILYFLIR